MRSRLWGYSWLRWILGCLVATCAGCSLEHEKLGSEQREARGRLTMPLKTTGRSGATYLLDGRFLIRNAAGAPVAALVTSEDPEASALSIDLDVGHYSVELLEGWRLERRFDDVSTTVEATLVSEPMVAVTVVQDQENVVLFHFTTGDGDVGAPQGSLDVAIAVDETAFCGNSVVDEGETCDDGSLTGQPDHCDASCMFVCQGACPLRVDPAAVEDGDGSSWQLARKFLQAAIDTQSALGGGEVWVRGPGPYQELAGDAVATLLHLRENVSVYGGFAGTELLRAQRDPSARTLIRGADLQSRDAMAPLVIGASRSTIDGFTVFEHDGAALVFHDAEDFRVSSFTLESTRNYRVNLVESIDSSGAFEGLQVLGSVGVDGVTGIYAERSSVQIANSRFSELQSLGQVAGIQAQDSALVLQNVWFIEGDAGGRGDAAGLLLTDSDVLAIDSVWLGNTGDLSALVSSNSRFFAVSSHWEANSSTAPPVFLLHGSIGSFLNCSFVANRTSSAGVLSIEDGDLEVVNASFVENDMRWPTAGEYPKDIGARGDSTVALFNTYSDQGRYSIFPPYTGGGNCLLDGGAPPHQTSEAGYRQVFLTPEFGCTDRGDVAAARDAAERAGEFAESLGVAAPLPSDWWQNASSVFPHCSDSDAIDPGRHHSSPSFCTDPE